MHDEYEVTAVRVLQLQSGLEVACTVFLHRRLISRGRDQGVTSLPAFILYERQRPASSKVEWRTGRSDADILIACLFLPPPLDVLNLATEPDSIVAIPVVLFSLILGLGFAAG